MSRLCACPIPLRDAAHPDRRFRCSRCGGATPGTRRLTLDETRRLIDQTQSRLAQLRVDLTYAHEAAYGIAGHSGSAGRGPGPSDPTGSAVASGINEKTGVAGGRAATATWFQIAAGKILRGAAWITDADEAAGNALMAADPHRGDDRRNGNWYDRAITAETPAEEIPDSRPDLQEAHAGLRKRRTRGEL